MQPATYLLEDHIQPTQCIDPIALSHSAFVILSGFEVDKRHWAGTNMETVGRRYPLVDSPELIVPNLAPQAHWDRPGVESAISTSSSKNHGELPRTMLSNL